MLCPGRLVPGTGPADRDVVDGAAAAAVQIAGLLVVRAVAVVRAGTVSERVGEDTAAQTDLTGGDTTGDHVRQIVMTARRMIDGVPARTAGTPFEGSELRVGPRVVEQFNPTGIDHREQLPI